jgi:hypothetical protein
MSLWRRILVERRTVVIPVAVLLAINVVVLIAVVLPLQQSVASAQEEVYASSMALTAAKAEEKRAEHAAAQGTQADRDLRQFYAEILPVDFIRARDGVQFWVASTARSLGLQHTGIETSRPTEVRDSRLRRVTAKFTLRGDYNNIRRFIYAVEAAEEFLIIERVQLAQPGVQQPTSTILEVDLDLATYFVGGGA